MVPLFALFLASASPAPTAPGTTAAAVPGESAHRVLLTAARGTASDDLKGVVNAELESSLPGLIGLEFITAGDLQRRLALEGEKQRYDCESDLTACVAELRSALGVPWAVFVDVDTLGDTASVALTLLGEDGAAHGRELVRTPVDGHAIGADLRPALARLVRPVQEAAGVVVVDGGPSAWLWGGGVGVGVGVVVAAIGLVPLVAHASASSSLTALRADGDVEGALDQAATYQQAQQQAGADWDQWGLPAVIVGAVLVGVGATALGVSALENP